MCQFVAKNFIPLVLGMGLIALLLSLIHESLGLAFEYGAFSVLGLILCFDRRQSLTRRLFGFVVFVLFAACAFIYGFGLVTS